MLEAVVRKALVEECGYQEAEPMMVAVSGGADSLALLKILKTLGWPIIAAHFDHHLRKSSSQEAATMKKLADEWDLPIVVGEEDVNAFAKSEHLGLEESARQCRYQFLFRVAKEKGVRAILTAHHADDQVETILMHFLRGAGFNGLEGMRSVSYLKQFSKEIPIWRPLLQVTKAELLSYCEEQGLVFFNDETNADLSYFRNALRHKLIPEIESIAPRFRKTTLRNARAIQKDNDLLQVGISPMAAKLCQQIRVDALSLSRHHILNSMPGRQTSLLKEAILALEPNLRDIGYEKLLKLVEKIQAGIRRSEVGQGLVMQIIGDKVVIQRKGRPVVGCPQIEAEICLEFKELPQLVSLSNGYSVLVETMIWSAYEGLPAAVKSDPMQAFLSFESSSFPLAIEPLRPGLRWQPLGMIEGSQKLSDSLINAKIPREARAKYPLLIMADEVAWVPGLRISHAFRLKEKELQMLHLKLQ